MMYVESYALYDFNSNKTCQILLELLHHTDEIYVISGKHHDFQKQNRNFTIYNNTEWCLVFI